MDELKSIISSKDEFYNIKLNIKREKHTKWSEDFAKIILVKLGVKYIVPIDNNKKFNLEDGVKTPDFIIGIKPNKIKTITNNNCYFYVDIKEITGAIYSNFKNDDNPIKQLIIDLKYNILSTQRNELITIIVPFNRIFGTYFLSFITLFFIDSEKYEKYKYDKDFKWLVKLVNKQNLKYQKGKK